MPASILPALDKLVIPAKAGIQMGVGGAWLIVGMAFSPSRHGGQAP